MPQCSSKTSVKEVWTFLTQKTKQKTRSHKKKKKKLKSEKHYPGWHNSVRCDPNITRTKAFGFPQPTERSVISVTVVIRSSVGGFIVGPLGLRFVLGPLWRALVLWRRGRRPGRRPSRGFIIRAFGAALFALVVRLLGVGLLLRSPPLHRAITAGLILVWVGGALGAAGLAAGSVPLLVGVAVRSDAFPVAFVIVWTRAAVPGVPGYKIHNNRKWINFK